MKWVRRGFCIGLASGAALLVLMAMLIWMAEISGAQEVGTPITAEAPTVSRVGAECAETWSAEWCASDAPIALCEARGVFCDVVSIETRPEQVGGFTAGDEFPGRPVVPDSLLWAIWFEPEFDAADHRILTAIAMCESGGRQFIRSTISSAYGWWQHLLRFVLGATGRLVAAGFPPDIDVMEPAVQTRITGRLWAFGSGWRHWIESFHCWKKYQ